MRGGQAALVAGGRRQSSGESAGPPVLVLSRCPRKSKNTDSLQNNFVRGTWPLVGTVACKKGERRGGGWGGGGWSWPRRKKSLRGGFQCGRSDHLNMAPFCPLHKIKEVQRGRSIMHQVGSAEKLSFGFFKALQ